MRAKSSKSPVPGIPERVQFAMAPMFVVRDNRIPRQARWLYTVICGRTDRRTRLCRLTLKAIADQEGISDRSIGSWATELELAGYLIRRDDLASGIYEVIRDPSRVETVKAANAGKVKKRKRKFGAFGKMGSARRKANSSSPRGEKAVAFPAKKGSPSSEDHNLVREYEEEVHSQCPDADNVPNHTKNQPSPPSMALDSFEHSSSRDRRDIDWSTWFQSLRDQGVEAPELWVMDSIESVAHGLGIEGSAAERIVERVLRRAIATRSANRHLNVFLKEAVKEERKKEQT